MIITRRAAEEELPLAQLLQVPAEALEAELHVRLAEAGFGDIRPPYSPIFAHLTPIGMPLGELVVRTRLTKQMVNYLLNAMEPLGYVERTADPADRRNRIVRLTPRGVEASRAAKMFVADIEREWTQLIGGGEMRYLRLLLRRLSTAIVAGSRAQPERPRS